MRKSYTTNNTNTEKNQTNVGWDYFTFLIDILLLLKLQQQIVKHGLFAKHAKKIVKMHIPLNQTRFSILNIHSLKLMFTPGLLQSFHSIKKLTWPIFSTINYELSSDISSYQISHTLNLNPRLPASKQWPMYHVSIYVFGKTETRCITPNTMRLVDDQSTHCIF